MSKWKEKYEKAHTAEVFIRDLREMDLAGWRGLEDYTLTIIRENRCLWKDWEDEHALTKKLRRRIAKLKERIAKRPAKRLDESVSTTGKWRKG